MSKLACGCPGSQVRTVEAKETANAEQTGRLQSELRQWPTQLHLVPPSAPWLQDADLLIAADCVPFAYAEFHRDFIKGKVLVNACPKLDDTSPYVEKLTEMLKQNDIRSLTVTIMEVPCCRGLAMMAQQALQASGKDIPLEVVVIGVDGERRN
ncbi:iron-sulfur cluster-binding oxidoreductase [Geothermobacter hydrogeniphilus]|uniref:Iron-sulfur cluster-binding oxidoreductase n=1 Tax=Geothermobacter hydrogeniphilus TaxID=1969733 RepID=A0A1X0YBF9_9BACT|nr:iron-sulfur cluster-binding oxidoreductase [Geothermobacter hydrogeniphilus]ORJ62508.1 iron-sulfur cluster-binding oxidoreductase [Geothermobacter hydrogeniphilus]